MTELEQLLKWAKKKHLYIQIYGDGSTEIEYAEDRGWYDTISSAPTLLSALRKAKERIEKGEKRCN